ncbi:hypothetical protein K1T71_004831 [Dendrolimus kikuchii]|uniref:Uncharacterized protein n=1 Tax=Dendrolimus kikuchii TaxID=765133 RepID=A0ACC1D597_9NEOP|nr:hypothetical protein K1T71_004831 [Dendrolimus kikuchii]
MTETQNVQVNLECILSKFSVYRLYYLKLFALLIFSGVTNAFYSVNYVFAAGDTVYSCKYSECDDSFVQSNHLSNLNRCHKYDFLHNSTTCSILNSSANQYTYCDEWIYNENKSFVEDFNLACQDWKRTLVGTVHSFGYMIGLLLTGPLADKFGRKKLLIFSGITAASMGLGRSITTSYWIYIALELVEALFGDTYSTTFMLGVEMVTKEDRVAFVTAMTAGTSIAGVVTAVTAWSLPYWRHFLRAIYGPALLFICYIFLLDESVRWLLIKGNLIGEALSVLKKAAKMSQITIDDSDLKNIDCEKLPSNTKFVSLIAMTITSKTLLMRFLACVLMWITGIFNKYALLINSVELEGDKYLNFGLATLSELPASLVLAYLLKRFKRRAPLIGSFVLTGLFCVGQAFVPRGNPWLSISLYLAGKFMATISYATVYLYTSELFPTYTRNTMHALCSSLGRVASILAPQTPLLTVYWSGLPSVIVGGLSLLTGMVIILMPDTAEDALPDTVIEAEAIGKGQAGDVTKL